MSSRSYSCPGSSAAVLRFGGAVSQLHSSVHHRCCSRASPKTPQHWWPLFVKVSCDTNVFICAEGTVIATLVIEGKSAPLCDIVDHFQNSVQACRCLQTLSKNGNYCQKQRNNNAIPHRKQILFVIFFYFFYVQF